MKIGYIHVSTEEQNPAQQQALLRELGVDEIFLDKAIDTTTPTGKFMLTVFAAVAELEREYILQRQREGIALAKAQGKYNGRPPQPLPGNFEAVAAQWRCGEIAASCKCVSGGTIQPVRARERAARQPACNPQQGRARVAVFVCALSATKTPRPFGWPIFYMMHKNRGDNALYFVYSNSRKAFSIRRTPRRPHARRGQGCAEALSSDGPEDGKQRNQSCVFLTIR